MNTIQRIEALLPWVNGDSLSMAKIRDALRAFLSPGDPVLGILTTDRVHTDRIVERELRQLSLAQADALYRDVIGALDAVSPDFTQHRSRDGYGHRLRSLRFTVARLSRRRPDNLSPRDRRRLLADPGCILMVAGELRDVVLFQLMRLLVTPGVLALDRCPAPLAASSTGRCDRWFVAVGERRGPTGRYCRAACRVRMSQATRERLGPTGHIVRKRRGR